MIRYSTYDLVSGEGRNIGKHNQLIIARDVESFHRIQSEKTALPSRKGAAVKRRYRLHLIA